MGPQCGRFLQGPTVQQRHLLRQRLSGDSSRCHLRLPGKRQSRVRNGRRIRSSPSDNGHHYQEGINPRKIGFRPHLRTVPRPSRRKRGRRTDQQLCNASTGPYRSLDGCTRHYRRTRQHYHESRIGPHPPQASRSADGIHVQRPIVSKAQAEMGRAASPRRLWPIESASILASRRISANTFTRCASTGKKIASQGRGYGPWEAYMMPSTFRKKAPDVHVKVHRCFLIGKWKPLARSSQDCLISSSLPYSRVSSLPYSSAGTSR